MFSRRLKRLGYEKEDLNGMNVQDIIALGKMGYSKEEIIQLQNDEGNIDIRVEIDSLKDTIDKMVKEMEVQNVHETVEENKPIENQVDEVLHKMMGE